MLAIFKCQQFENCVTDKTEPRLAKLQHINVHNNVKRQDLDKYKDEIEYEKVKSIFFPFVTSFSLF